MSAELLGLRQAWPIGGSGARRRRREGSWAASAVEVESRALLSLSVDVLDSHEQVVDRQRSRGVGCGKARGEG